MPKPRVLEFRRSGWTTALRSPCPQAHKGVQPGAELARAVRGEETQQRPPVRGRLLAGDASVDVPRHWKSGIGLRVRLSTSSVRPDLFPFESSTSIHSSIWKFRNLIWMVWPHAAQHSPALHPAAHAKARVGCCPQPRSSRYPAQRESASLVCFSAVARCAAAVRWSTVFSRHSICAIRDA